MFALLTGALVPLQLAFNGQLGSVTRSAITASLVVFLMGAVILLIITAALRPALPSLADLLAAPRTVWLGGVIATVYIIAIVILTPKLGVGATTTLILVGQLCMAVTLDHFGAFGSPQISLNLWRLAGIGLMITGVVMIKTH